MVQVPYHGLVVACPNQLVLLKTTELVDTPPDIITNFLGIGVLQAVIRRGIPQAALTGACVAPRVSALSCVGFSWAHVIDGDVLRVSPVGFPAVRSAL